MHGIDTGLGLLCGRIWEDGDMDVARATGMEKAEIGRGPAGIITGR
ncbi:hypothetical protein MTHERMOG20_08030 [Moorella thermoacetica]|nr:hypothetical protein [Moorella thermoacetica]GLI16349.1 hypothetical protein MTHERMOG20_08030 [Moorella thermoacetica]